MVLPAAFPVFDPPLKHAVLSDHVRRNLLQNGRQLVAEFPVDSQEFRRLDAVGEEVSDQGVVHGGGRRQEHLFGVAVDVVALLG